MRRFVTMLATMLSITAWPGITYAAGLSASATSSGQALMVTGANPYDLKSTCPVNGSIQVQTLDMGNRWSPLQNTDQVNVAAAFDRGRDHYEIIIHRPMVRHPLGKYTTFFGVAYKEPMNGNTTVGTSALPKVVPDIALWGWAKVKRNGELVATAVPAHVKVMRAAPVRGILLEVGTEDRAMAGTPNGYLSVLWPSVKSISTPQSLESSRQWLGWAILVLLNIGFGWLALAEQRRNKRHS